MRTDRKRKISPVYKILFYAIFIVYLLLLFKIVLFKYTSPLEVLQGFLSGEQRGYHSLNLIPFQTVLDFVEITGQGHFLRGFSNILGNVCIFAPLGYFLPFLWEKFRKLSRVFVTGLGLSLLFELGQYFLYLGSADIDDVILNTLGAGLGYSAYLLVDYFLYREILKYRATLLISAVCFAASFVVAREQFGTILGLSNYQVDYEGREYIPDRSSDHEGTFIGLDGKILSYYPAFIGEGSDEESLLSQSEIKVTDQTKYVGQEVENRKDGATIKYFPLEEEEVLQIGKYSKVRIWARGEEADTVLFINTVEDTGGSEAAFDVKEEETGREPEQEKVADQGKTAKEIWGEIKELTEDGFVINMGTTEELENGSSIATISVENENLVTVKLLSDTQYSKVTIHDSLGKNVDREEGSRDDLSIDTHVTLTGYVEEGVFVAQEVKISIFDLR